MGNMMMWGSAAVAANRSVLFGAKEKPKNQPKRAPQPAQQPSSQPATQDPPLTWPFMRPQATDVLRHSQGFETRVTSLIDGGQIFNSIDTLLRQAKDSVLVNMYEIQSPEVNPHRSSPPGTPGADKQAKIAANLIDLAKRGVKVKVILDNSYDDQKKEYHNEAMIEHLRSNGVEVITYPRTAAEISHVKLLIVDGKFAVIGGMNWGNHSAVNHDACVLLEGDDVGNLAEQIFKVDYEFSGGDAATLPPHRTIPEERIKVLTTAPCGSPCGGNNEIYEQILQRIDGAQHSIVAQLFVLTDKTVAQKLKEAHERMIAAGTPGVQILVDPGLYLKFKNCRKMVDQLHQDGVPIRFYKSNWADEQKLHGKWAVFDEQELLIGSANWSKVGLQSNCPTNISFNSQNQFEKGNHEANVAIQSKQLCKAFLRQFAYDWEKRSFTVEGGFKSILQTIPFNLRDQILGPRKPKPAPAAEVPPAPAPDAPAPDNVVPMPTPPTKRRKTEG